MATSKATTEDLSDQIAALKNDISSITSILSDLGTQKSNEAQSALRSVAQEAKARGEAHLHDVQVRAEDMGAQAANAVRQQPAVAIGIAVGVGFLFGMLTSRK